MSRLPIQFAFMAAIIGAICCVNVYAQNPAPQRMTAVWMEPGKISEDSELQIGAALEKEYPADAVIHIPYEIKSPGFIGKTEIKLFVFNAAQEELINGVQTLDLISGVNPVNFSIDAASLAPGDYTLLMDVDYVDKVGVTSYTVPFSKVDSDLLLQQLAEFKNRAESIEAKQRMENASNSSTHLRTRILLGKETIKHAEEDASLGRWHELDHKLEYLRYVVNSSYAAIAMGGVFEERMDVVTAPDLRNLQIQDGALQSNNRPIYLFGANMTEPSPEKIARVASIGLQFAAISINASAIQDWELFQQKYDPLFAAASEYNVALAVQLLSAQADASNGNREELGGLLKKILPYLQGKDMVFTVNIMDNPRFQFTGDAVRGEFIDLVKKQYPDRIDLNRAWRSHLASYDDIEIWGDYPEYSYQNRRAFQFDWQQYHQELGTRYFTWAVQSIKDIAPTLPLTITLPNNAFSQGESRYGVDREAVAQMTDLNGCTSSISPYDKIYSMSYPHQSAYYALLRSIQPDKPVLNLDNRLEFVENMDPVWIRAYVQTAMWESVMTGLSASAFSYASNLFDFPDAIDAMATASLDINRLAPVIHAFGRSPHEVAILYSKSSKIFDDGKPHLESAWYSYEGTSFAGYGTRFITESQIANGDLQHVRVLVLPETPAVADATFETINGYALGKGNLVRVGNPIPYNEHGFSRRGTIKHTANTILVRGMNLPTEYLHAMDAIIDIADLPTIPRTVNSYGFPIEGVKSRYVNFDGKDYLYVVSLRKEPILVDLHGHMQSGRDVIRGREVTFPRMIRPLDPMLIELRHEEQEVALSAAFQ